MTKFQNKYRVETTRAQWWDYGWNGAYFITICTQGRVHHFGHIENNQMILSPTGVIADILWKQIPDHFPFVELGAFPPKVCAGRRRDAEPCSWDIGVG